MMRHRMILLIILAITFNVSSGTTQTHFTFTAGTGNSAVVAIPLAANPNISGVPIASGDEIGAFTPAGLCVGAIVWQEANAALTVWGNNTQTTEVDGIQVGEEISYRIWQQAAGTEHSDVTVSYAAGDGIYSVNSNFVLSSISAVGQAAVSELILETAPEQTIDTEFWLDVAVHSAQDLFGISFEINYTDTELIDVVEPEASSIVPGPFLGDDVVFLHNLDDVTGRVGIGVSKKAGQDGVSGTGVVARIKFRSLLATPVGTEVSFSIGNLFALDTQGNEIQLTTTDTTVTLRGVLVWPGDTNNDGLVDQADVLPIGLAWGLTGPSRQEISMSWTGHVAAPWSPRPRTFVDANGDGMIDQTDVLAVGFNWGKTQDVSALLTKTWRVPEVAASGGQTVLRTTIRGNMYSGVEFWVEVHVEDAADLFGLSFELSYEPMDHFLVQEVVSTDWIGHDALFLPIIEHDSGKIGIGLSRKAGQGGMNGSGVVARIRMSVAQGPAAGQELGLVLQNVVANDQFGRPIHITVENSSNPTGVEDSVESLPDAFALHTNYPNPFNPETTIRYDVLEPGPVSITIFNLLGRRVRTLTDRHRQPGRYSLVWDARDDRGRAVASGMYIYRLRAGGFVMSRKMMLQR